MPRVPDEPLRKVTLNLYEADVRWMQNRYGGRGGVGGIGLLILLALILPLAVQEIAILFTARAL